MYKRLTRSRIHAELAPSPILGVKNYLNNYFIMYTRLKRFRIHAEVEAPLYMGLRII